MATIAISLAVSTGLSFLSNALFPPDDIEGPRVDEFRVGGQREGAPRVYALGSLCRVDARPFWIGSIQEVEDTQEIGKGGGQERTSYRYFASLGIEVADVPGLTLKKIIAEGQVVYDVEAGSDIAAVVTMTPVGQRFLDITGTGIDFSTFKTGRDATLSGSANNDGDHRVVFADSARLRLRSSLLVSGFTLETTGVTLMQDLPAIPDGMMSGIEFHSGDTVPDSLIEAAEGVGQVPAWPDSTRAVFDSLALEPFGNRVPLTWAAIFEEGGRTLGSAITRVLTLAGISTALYDVSALTAQSVRGFRWRAGAKPAETVRSLMRAFHVLDQQVDGVVRLFPRDQARVWDIPEEHIGAAAVGEAPSLAPEFSDDDDVEVPSEVAVGFLDFDADCQPGSQAQPLSREATNPARLSTEVVMTGGEARALAMREGYLYDPRRREVVLPLPPIYRDLRENDLVSFTCRGERHLVLVEQIDKGVGGLIVARARVEIPELLEQPEPADEHHEDQTSNGTVLASHLEVVIETDITFGPAPGPGPGIPGPGTPGQPVLGVAVVQPDDDEPWRGAVIYWSDEEDGEYGKLVELQSQAIMGFAVGVLADHADPSTEDASGSVVIELWRGSLESRLEAAVLAGANQLWIGGEVVGFETASLDSPRRWEISDLWRGRRGTEHATGTHAADEPCVLISQTGWALIPYPLELLGETRWFKVAAPGADLDEIEPIEVVLTGGSLKPWAPVDLDAAPAGDDILISWTRRTRTPYSGSTGIVPLGEEFHRFEVEIMDGPDVIRTLTVDDADEVTYLKDDHMHDVSTYGIDLSSLTVRVYQISAHVGRGRVAEATLDATA